VLTTLVVLLRLIGLICPGHRSVALKHLALRQQLAPLTAHDAYLVEQVPGAPCPESRKRN
jgi:hypothetical protein